VADGTTFSPRTAIPAGGTAGTGALGDSGQGNRAPSGGPLPNGAVPAADHGKPLQWLIGIVAAVLAVLTVLTLLGFALYELNGGAATRAYPERDDPGQRTTNVTAA
jgi:hypothetical protein